MTVIELSDEQAAALKAKAAAQGLTLQAWLASLAGVPLNEHESEPRVRYSLAELVANCDPSAPLSEEDQAWLDEPATGREA